jgi:hypothetical protein
MTRFNDYPDPQHSLKRPLTSRQQTPGYPDSATKLTTSEGPYRPACFWVAGSTPDRKNDLKDGDTGIDFPDMARQINFHLDDFRDIDHLPQSYNMDSDLLCKVEPRFKWWTKAPTWHRIFDPPLDYGPFTARAEVEEAQNSTDDYGSPLLIDHYNYINRDYLLNQTHWGKSQEVTRRSLDKHRLRARTVANELASKRASLSLSRRSLPDDDDEIVTSPPKVLENSSRIFFSGNTTFGYIKQTTSSRSARHLCSKLHFFGPDVYNVAEGLFCDVESKRLYAVCGRASRHRHHQEDVAQDACFDADAEQLVQLAAKDAAPASSGGVWNLFSAPNHRKVLKMLASPLEMGD